MVRAERTDLPGCLRRRDRRRRGRRGPRPGTVLEYGQLHRRGRARCRRRVDVQLGRERVRELEWHIDGRAGTRRPRPRSSSPRIRNRAPTTRARLLEQGADDLGAAGWDPAYGYGLVDPRVSANRARAEVDGAETPGYRVVGRDGRVVVFGTAAHRGDLAGHPLSAPIVAAAGTPSGNGYWLAGADGAVVRVRRRGYLGSMAGRPLNGRIVGIAATPSGHGYVLLGSDGGIFTFGDAGLLRIDRRPFV